MRVLTISKNLTCENQKQQKTHDLLSNNSNFANLNTHEYEKLKRESWKEEEEEEEGGGSGCLPHPR